MASGGSSLILACMLLTTGVSRVGRHRLRSPQVSVAATLGSAAVAHRLSRLVACGMPRPGTETRVLLTARGITDQWATREVEKKAECRRIEAFELWC